MAQPLILVADDNHDMRFIFRTILELEGYAVVEAGDGGEAVRLAHRHRPVLVFLDLMMPVMDGWEAMLEMKGRRETRDIAVVAITASSTPAAAFRDAGFCALLRKPVRPAEVVDSVDRCLEAHRKGEGWVQLRRSA
jgi:CheY-like chemotaxis protein